MSASERNADIAKYMTLSDLWGRRPSWKKSTFEVRLNFSYGRLPKISELFSERVGAVDFFCHPVGEFSQFYPQSFNSVRVIFGNLFSERAFDLLRSGVFIDIQCF